MADFLAKDRLSLCLIVRDEADNLPRLLASVQAWVGQIVMVDTGSVDESVTIAKAWGAHVQSRRWQNSFAVARNQCLELAQTPWVLLLDADEELVVTDDHALAEALLCETSTHPPAYAIDCHDLRDDGQVAVAPLLRLFRRDLPHMRFEGAVHEQLMAVSRNEVNVGHASFMHFRHDGHVAAAMEKKHKDQRNLSLARPQVDDRPNDPFAWFCLGQALLTTPNLERREEATKAYSQALARLGPQHAGEAFVVSLFANQAQTQRQLERPLDALTTLHAGVGAFPHSPDLRLARAQLLMQHGQFAQAEADLKVCLSEQSAQFFLRLDPAATGHKARTQLALCFIKQVRFPEALRQLEQAAREAPAGDELARTLLQKLLSGSP